VSFWSEHKVINLDGVINNDAAHARFKYKTLDYIVKSPAQYWLRMRDGLYATTYFDEASGERARMLQTFTPVAKLRGTEYFYGGQELCTIKR